MPGVPRAGSHLHSCPKGYLTNHEYAFAWERCPKICPPRSVPRSATSDTGVRRDLRAIHQVTRAAATPQRSSTSTHRPQFQSRVLASPNAQTLRARRVQGGQHLTARHNKG